MTVRSSAGEEKSFSRTKRYRAFMANESLGYRLAASSKGSFDMTCIMR